MEEAYTWLSSFPVAVQLLLHRIAAEYGTSVPALRRPNRSWNRVRARSAAMSIMRHELGMTYSDIGRVFFMHHTTVIYHLRTVKKVRHSKAVAARAIAIDADTPDLSGEWAI